MKSIVVRAYLDNKVVGDIKIGASSATTATGSIQARKAGAKKKWALWQHSGWWELPQWDRLEIIDAN